MVCRRHAGALLELRSGQEMFNGSLLEINAIGGTNSSAIRTIVDGVTTFDVATAGNVTVASMRIVSGGVEVTSGGVQIGAGGLSVHDGLTIQSGSLDIGDATLTAPSIHVNGRDPSSPVLVVETVSDNYLGTALSLKGPIGAPTGYTMIGAEVAGQTVFSVTSGGSVTMGGDLKVQQNMDVAMHTRLNGGLSLAKTTLQAADTIHIPATAVFVDVLDDQADEANVLVMPTRSDGSYEGQVLIIRNNDKSSLQMAKSGQYLPFDSTALFVFDGSEWRDIHALSAHLDKLTGLTSLEVSNDIYIGNHTFEAGGFKASSINRGEVVVGGIDGVLRGRQGLTYKSGVLSTPSIKVDTLESDIDAKSKTIS